MTDRSTKQKLTWPDGAARAVTARAMRDIALRFFRPACRFYSATGHRPSGGGAWVRLVDRVHPQLDSYRAL